MIEERNQIGWIIDELALLVCGRFKGLNRHGERDHSTNETHSQTTCHWIRENRFHHHSVVQEIHPLFELRCFEKNAFRLFGLSVGFESGIAPHRCPSHTVARFLVGIHAGQRMLIAVRKRGAVGGQQHGVVLRAIDRHGWQRGLVMRDEDGENIDQNRTARRRELFQEVRMFEETSE